jgi:hypothetical protein
MGHQLNYRFFPVFLRTRVNRTVKNIDNRAREAYTAGCQYDAKKTPSPRVAPGGGGPTKD